MACIMFTNFKCPICNHEAHYPPGYNPRQLKTMEMLNGSKPKEDSNNISIRLVIGL